MIVYDAEKQVAGRMCTEIAHKLKQGETIVIVNAERAIVTGRPRQRFRELQVQEGPRLHSFRVPSIQGALTSS